MEFTHSYSKWTLIRTSRRTRTRRKRSAGRRLKSQFNSSMTGNMDIYFANRNRKCSSKKAWLCGSSEGLCCFKIEIVHSVPPQWGPRSVQWLFYLIFILLDLIRLYFDMIYNRYIDHTKHRIFQDDSKMIRNIPPIYCGRHDWN